MRRQIIQLCCLVRAGVGRATDLRQDSVHELRGMQAQVQSRQVRGLRQQADGGFEDEGEELRGAREETRLIPMLVKSLLLVYIRRCLMIERHALTTEVK